MRAPLNTLSMRPKLQRTTVCFKESECFMLEGTSESLYCNCHLKASSAVRSGQAVQGFTQSGLENLQGWRVPSPSGQPAPMLGCPRSEKGFPCVQSERFVSIYNHCSLSAPCEEPGIVVLKTSS